MRLRCPGCNELVRRREAAEHWACCGMLPVMCRACDHMCFRGELQAHQAECIVLNAPTPPPPPPPAQFVCQLCMESELVDGSFEAATHDSYGQHNFCFECTASHAAHEIDKLSEGAPPHVTCPAVGCSVRLTYHEVQGLSELRQPIRLAPASFDKYVRLVTLEASRRLPGFTACPAGCGWGAVLPPRQQFLQCEGSCHKWFCLHCQRDGIAGPDCAHDRHVSCEDHRLQINHAGAADALLLRAQTKPCPGCHEFATKEPDVDRQGAAHSCMRVVHTNCSGRNRGLFTGSKEHTRFCWCCLAPQRPIDEHDLSFHRRECLLWVGPQGEYSHKANCFLCSRKGDGTFCDARPASSCTRRTNGAIDKYQSHFCACQHGCPCDSVISVRNECNCPEAIDRGSNNCACGRNQVHCGACDTTLCRLCGRAPHAGYKCIEDRLESDPAPPDESARLVAAARATEGTSASQARRRSSGSGSSSSASSSGREMSERQSWRFETQPL